MARVVNMNRVKRDRLARELADELREHGCVHQRIAEIDDVVVWRQGGSSGWPAARLARSHWHW